MKKVLQKLFCLTLTFALVLGVFTPFLGSAATNASEENPVVVNAHLIDSITISLANNNWPAGQPETILTLTNVISHYQVIYTAEGERRNDLFVDILGIQGGTPEILMTLDTTFSFSQNVSVSVMFFVGWERSPAFMELSANTVYTIECLVEPLAPSIVHWWAGVGGLHVDWVVESFHGLRFGVVGGDVIELLGDRGAFFNSREPRAYTPDTTAWYINLRLDSRDNIIGPGDINIADVRKNLRGDVSSWRELSAHSVAQLPITATASRTLRFAIDSATFTDNGIQYNLDAAPFIADDRTMVPLRNIIEAFGVTPQFNDGVIIFTIGGTPHTMTIGQPLSDDMGTPVIVADRTFVPLRFVMDTLDSATVRWDGDARAAYVYIE